MKASSDLAFRHRKWHGLAAIGGLALTAFSIQFTGINLGLQILIAAAFTLLAIVAYVRSTMERLGDLKPEWPETPTRPNENRRDFPDPTLAAYFDLTAGAPSLDERITMLAQVCGEFGRHVGVMNFQFGVADRDELKRAFSALRAGIRRTDLLERVSEKEVVVCLNMIRDVHAVEGVTRRLTQALERQRIDPSAWTVGCAISPIHGYTGADLIAFARHAHPPSTLPREPGQKTRKGAAAADRWTTALAQADGPPRGGPLHRDRQRPVTSARSPDRP